MVTEENTEKDVPRFKNDKLMIKTLAITSIFAFLLYTVPTWVLYEQLTSEIIKVLLDFLDIAYSIAPVITADLRGGPFPFIEATDETPGLYLHATNGFYYIVKACTGMQAGAMILGLILVSEAKWNKKLLSGIVFFFVLFFTNALRITFHYWLVIVLHVDFGLDSQTAFYWAHDVLSKVIGFFGTIFFAIIIEKMDVPIIDTFADWLDWMFWRIKYYYGKIFS